jgi:hypothetical protein
VNADDPRHGKRAGYLAGCHDDCCAIPNRRWTKRYRLQAARNGGRTTVPAEPIKAHVLELQKSMSLCSIGKASGTSSAQLSRVLQGVHARMRTATAAAIMAVRPDNPVGGHYISAIGSRRRLQALAAIGYSFERLAPRLGGYGTTNMRILAYQERPWITSDVAIRIKTAYDELSMQLPAAPDRFHQASITKARNRAKAQGWVPPLAWDDETIDDPNAHPVGIHDDHKAIRTVDESLILRRMAGDRTAKTRGPENCEVVRRLLAGGRSQRWIRDHTGLKVERYLPHADSELEQEAAA